MVTNLENGEIEVEDGVVADADAEEEVDGVVEVDGAEEVVEAAEADEMEGMLHPKLKTLVTHRSYPILSALTQLLPQLLPLTLQLERSIL